MSPNIGWGDIAIRLALTLLAGAVIGFNRGERHQQAGLRTTMLVCLAGSVTTILVNVLFPAVHQPEGLFRLSQGLLSGIGSSAPAPSSGAVGSSRGYHRRDLVVCDRGRDVPRRRLFRAWSGVLRPRGADTLVPKMG
jgi:hypothetical protein